jgi:hypothetical protein
MTTAVRETPGASQASAINRQLADGSVSIPQLVRAFGVMAGPSAVLDAIGAACVASTARALARRERPSPVAVAGTALTGAYVAVIRRKILHWGADAEEAQMSLPGDELVPSSGSQSTRAVTVDAPVEEVWPWLAQIGQDRAGFYSYEWLENLAGCRMRNADEVHPEWQHRAIGETVYLHHLYGQPVARFEENRVVALRGWGAFVLERLEGNRTRLLARSRTARGPSTVFNALLIEIPHFVMERRMLLGIKQRAEGVR